VRWVLLAVGGGKVAAVLLAASVDGVLRAASVGITLSPPASVVVLLNSIFLLITISPCPGRDFISLQTRKEMKQRNAFQTANT
jgi:hypothetical protein